MNDSVATSLFMKCMILAMNHYQSNELKNASLISSDFNITDATTWKDEQRLYANNEYGNNEGYKKSFIVIYLLVSQIKYLIHNAFHIMLYLLNIKKKFDITP